MKYTVVRIPREYIHFLKARNYNATTYIASLVAKEIERLKKLEGVK